MWKSFNTPKIIEVMNLAWILVYSRWFAGQVGNGRILYLISLGITCTYFKRLLRTWCYSACISRDHWVLSATWSGLSLTSTRCRLRRANCTCSKLVYTDLRYGSRFQSGVSARCRCFPIQKTKMHQQRTWSGREFSRFGMEFIDSSFKDARIHSNTFAFVREKHSKVVETKTLVGALSRAQSQTHTETNENEN
jgi:hypothetical protein